MKKRLVSDRDMNQFETRAKVLKVDSDLGLVLGWAIVCTEEDMPYFDLQKDHIPDDAMLAAATDFMQDSRVAAEMHDGEDAGTVVFAFPLTKEVAKAFGITCAKTGLMIGMRPDAGMLEKFKSGELTGFSIGGRRGEDETVE